MCTRYGVSDVYKIRGISDVYTCREAKDFAAEVKATAGM
jgi:hypothetical protein